MLATDNLLIVEDETEWRGAYTRAAATEGISTIKIAEDLASARALIDDMRFAVAVIDIGLNVGDDQNVDGLRVMEKIRDMGDETSIVVITGRSGRDVLPITRDAIMKYKAHGIVGKAEIEPQDLRKLLQTGLLAFGARISKTDPAAHEVLRGETPAWQWDDQMMRSTGVTGGVNGLYDFLDHLISGFLPVVARRAADSIALDEPSGVMNGSYWSRSTGKPIVVCFGRAELAEQEEALAQASGMLLGRYPVGSALHSSSGHALSGAVFELKDAAREDFLDAR